MIRFETTGLKIKQCDFYSIIFKVYVDVNFVDDWSCGRVFPDFNLTSLIFLKFEVKSGLGLKKCDEDFNFGLKIF